MKFKFLGTAAALLGAVSTAQAADLGKKAPAAVDYVKVCDAYGAGFFYIPGGDTCLKIGGYMRARALTGTDNRKGTADGSTGEFVPGLGSYSSAARSNNTYGTSFTASVTFDARTSTDFGTLRSFIDARPASGEIDRAFVQFGGLTAGFATSAYFFQGGAGINASYGPFLGDFGTNMIAYTASLSKELSATISLEDPTSGKQRSAGGVKWGALDPISGTDAVGLPGYGGNRVPNIVGNVNLSQAWGSAQISAVAQQNYDELAAFGDEWGYAVQGGVKVNLPMIAAGDYIQFVAAYTEGAVRYLNLNGLANDYHRLGTSTLDKTKAWSVNGSFLHVFAPSVSAALDLGYADVDQTADNDFTVLRASSAVYWWPVAGQVRIGLSAEYQAVNYSNGLKDAYVTANPGRTLGDANLFQTSIEIRRYF